MRWINHFTLVIALLLTMGVSQSLRAENKLLARMTSKIDADPKKTYKLDKAHGPWMVMVASFHEAGGQSEKRLGKSPLEAANELVLEFRRLKPPVPAYVYVVKDKNEAVKAHDQLGREQRMKNLRVIDSVCVLAGNYLTIDEPKAQRTLKFIKQFQPKCLETGVDFTVSPGRPGPLSKAFLTPNPLLTGEELEASKQANDPLLAKLNNNEQFSLYENKGKFTLVVARFSGKSVHVVNETMEKAESYFNTGGNDLDLAGQSARDLVRTLRSRDPVAPDAELQPYCRIDAYVWHDYNQSIVTVGSFESKNDPAIQKYVELFGPRVRQVAGGRPSIEYRSLPVRDENQVVSFIPFETSMQLMSVPHGN